MKVKTSVSLSKDLLDAIDQVAREGESRSAILEAAATEWIRRRVRSETFAEEVARLNAIVDGPEPPDVLDYSIDPSELGEPFPEAEEIGAG